MTRRLAQPLTQEQLHHLFLYDPETGEFTHRTYTQKMKRKVGDKAGTHAHTGYRRISISGQRYYAHHLAWLYMTGKWDESIDHANRDGSDNRWLNLRPATASQQAANRGKNKNNTSGFRGVSFDRQRQKFAAYLTKDRVRRFLGFFSTAEEAHAAYVKAAREGFGLYACSG
jgi:hypothetical protein